MFDGEEQEHTVSSCLWQNECAPLNTYLCQICDGEGTRDRSYGMVRAREPVLLFIYIV